MSQRHELEQRLSSLREQARRGATPQTFEQYEALFRAARTAGEQELATDVMRDLSVLTQELDPATAKLLARAAGPQRRDVDVTVVVLGLADGATAAPALASLDRQTLPRSCFETILADRADAAAVNAAAAAARGKVLVFVAPDVTLAADALQRHVAAHAEGTPAAFVLGALDCDGLSLRPLAWSLERLGLLGCQHAPEEGGEAPAECVAFDHASILRDRFAKAGGCDVALTRLAPAEFGLRLAAAGVRCLLVPEIRATQATRCDLDGWLARARSIGSDSLRLRRKLGAGAPPSWLRDVGIEEPATERLYGELLAAADGHARRVASLRESLHEIEKLLARDPARADPILAKVGDDLGKLILEVTRHELSRGFVHAALGGKSEALEPCATRTRRGAAVLVAGTVSVAPAVSVALGELPAWGEIVVAVPAGVAPPALPDDPRVSTFRLPPASAERGGNGSMRRALLAATGADFFVLLDGSCVPTRGEWEALRLTLATLPSVGACGVDGATSRYSQAKACTTLPESLVAARRDVVEGLADGGGAFVERLVGSGFRLATTTAAAPTTTGVEPAACSG